MAGLRRQREAEPARPRSVECHEAQGPDRGPARARRAAAFRAPGAEPGRDLNVHLELFCADFFKQLIKPEKGASKGDEFHDRGG